MDYSSLLKIGTGSIVVLSILGALLIGFIVYLCFVPMKNYFTALFSGAYIPTFKLISIKNRKLNVSEITQSYCLAKKSKLDITLAQIESLILSGGDVNEVIKALNLAKNSNKELSYELASAIELATHNVYEAVSNSIVSKVVEINDISGVTKDGIEVIVNANISVKVKLDNYVKGVGLEELKNSVTTWIMEKIVKEEDHSVILREPNFTLLKGLDLKLVSRKSIYELLDVNIASVKVGRDLNIEREIKAAEKEKIYASIEAERLKNNEEIKEIQQRSETERKKHDVLEAEAEVPRALSQAIKEGRFSVMDYYKLMNLQADTALRRAFLADKDDKDSDEGDDFEWALRQFLWLLA